MSCRAIRTLGFCVGLGAAVTATNAGAVDLIGGKARPAGRSGFTPFVYGQANKAFFWADDGQAGYQLFGLVDNANSSTRMGVDFSSEPGYGWLLTGKIEFQFEEASTAPA